MDGAAVREVAHKLRDAEQSVRVLRGLEWGPEVKEEFFRRGERELPRVVYPAFDPGPVLQMTGEARARVGAADGAVARWCLRNAEAIESSARLLASPGTPEFLEHGVALYGRPDEAHDEGEASPLELARRVETLWRQVEGIDLGEPAPACHLAEGVAERMRAAVQKRFGDEAPQVVVVDRLSANALAGPRAIRVRRGACFTDRDVLQLIQHEAFVHVCTALNGRAQVDLPVLGASHQGTARTQEGLAVFAELISGSLEPDRFRRLADRVLAIQMVIEGADFLQVYRFFLGRGTDRDQAFENARRVFRGGVLTGGVPFLKDVVYLDGLLRVTNFLRALVAEGRVDCLLLLFCGKLDLDDVPALSQLAAAGLCRPPRHLPPWVADRRFLVAYLAYSSFLNQVRLDRLRAHYATLLAEAPRLVDFGSTRSTRPAVSAGSAGVT